MDENIIEIHDLIKIYKSETEETFALDGVDLNVETGEFLAIMGPSGSGKSTLMHILGLLDVPTMGTYKLDGIDVSKITKNTQSELRNKKIGFVFQQFNLLPRTRILDNILLPAVYGKLCDSRNKANELIEKLGLKEFSDHKSNQLSGGQIQRVAIARSLIMNPSLILADEPTGNLDTARSMEIMELFRKINSQGTTIVLITHEEDIAKFADRIIRLRDGKIISEEKVNHE
jgi:putative ABC transport system ATP-binding protein